MISFNQIPSNIRVPLFYSEYDNSNANQGLTGQVFKTLMIGQKTSGGTAVADVPVQIFSKDQAKGLFGAGSMLHRMAEKYFKNNLSVELWCIPSADNGAGVAATGTATISGPATKAGTLSLYIGGRLVQVAIAIGDIDDDIAADIAAAVNADTDLPVTAGVASEVVTFTAKNKGINGNKIALQMNLQSDQATPAGVGVVLVQMASGATNPVLTTMIAAMGDVQYNLLINPYTDATSLTALEAELASRAGPTRQIDGNMIAVANDTVGNLTTLGNSRNSQFSTIFGAYKFPNPPEEVAAAAAGQIAGSAQIDVAMPFQTLQLVDIMAPAIADRFQWNERNTLLYDGISTLKVGPGGVVQIEQAITTYQLNSYGVADPSYLLLNVPLMLSYLRYTQMAVMTSKYGRCKLAKDGTRFGPGQKVITPKTAKAEYYSIFTQWELDGKVEGFEQFKKDLIVEINATNPNRLDVLMAPDLMNQLTVMGVKIAYLL